MSFVICWKINNSNSIRCRYGFQTMDQADQFSLELLQKAYQRRQAMQTRLHQFGYWTPLFYQKFKVWQSELPRIREFEPHNPSDK